MGKKSLARYAKEEHDDWASVELDTTEYED